MLFSTHGMTMLNEILKTSYYTLRTLRHLKDLTDFHLTKNLAESGILSKINFAITIYGNCQQQFHSKRLQKLINGTAGFVCKK